MSIQRIMVVDDSPTERHVLGEILTRQGYHVILVGSGEDAIVHAKAALPDLILMDVVMPGMNGFQATRTIRRAEETKHIPIILCTTKGQPTDKVWGLRQGASDYMVKPVDAQVLLMKIKGLDVD